MNAMRAKWPLSAWASLVVTALTIAGSSALAQSAPADRDRQPRTETEGQSPSASENLSERLDRSKGVIQPPQVIDPSMQVTSPNPDSRMPVIPPPGTPGGDRTLEPK
jgi:hypothetical protein